MKITLLQNAYSFLSEALAKAIEAENEAIHWKFATLNLVQAVELSLKERLRREHILLIYQNVDKPRNTVNLITSLNRLNHIPNIELSNYDIEAITKASELRNQIVHFEFDLDEKQIKIIFSKILGFLSHFHAVFLDSKLYEVIDPYLWVEAVRIYDFTEELYSRAIKTIADMGINSDNIIDCPNCEYDTCVVNNNEANCYFCGYNIGVAYCYNCKEMVFENEWHELKLDDETYESFCLECYEETISNDDRFYSEMMSHFWDK